MRRIVSFSSIDSNRNKINVWPVAKGFRDRRGGGGVRRRRASKLSVAVIAWRARIIRFPVR